MDDKRHSRDIFIPAGIFIGLGVGIFTKQVGACVLIGLGAGMLLSAIIGIVSRNSGSKDNCCK